MNEFIIKGKNGDDRAWGICTLYTGTVVLVQRKCHLAQNKEFIIYKLNKYLENFQFIKLKTISKFGNYNKKQTKNWTMFWKGVKLHQQCYTCQFIFIFIIHS